MDSDPRFRHGETNYLGALALGGALLLGGLTTLVALAAWGARRLRSRPTRAR